MVDVISLGVLGVYTVVCVAATVRVIRKSETSERPLVTDGGSERRGKEAPPEEILAAPANTLETEPHPRDVTSAVTDLIEAVDAVIEAADDSVLQEGRGSMPPMERATRLVDAIEHGKISISSEGGTGHDSARTGSGTHIGQSQTLQEAVQKTRHQHTIESRTALRLLDDLETASDGQADQLSRTLSSTVETLERYHQLKTTLAAVQPGQSPRRLGETLTRNFEGSDQGPAESLLEIGEILEQQAEKLEYCQTERETLAELTSDVCAAATEQSGYSFDSDASESARNLAQALQNDQLWFVDDTTSISRLVADVEASGTAQSKPADEFLHVLRNAQTVDDRQITDAIRDAVTSIDRAETVNTRLEGVDPDGLIRTADRLLSDLSNESQPVASHLEDRISDIRDTAKRSNEDDLLTLYAARQELRYYDRSLIPQLSQSETVDRETTNVANRIETVDDRRGDMRQSYPTEYPDCDHTIPIYFFDLVSELLETAKELQTRGEIQRALGTIDAAEDMLDWIEGLYETHSYFVLLKQLRG